MEDLKLENLEQRTFSEMEDMLQPLDPLWFRGKDRVSSFIRLLEKIMVGNGTFSHCGVVVTRDLMPWLKVLKPGVKYVWESTMSIPLGGFTDGVVDVETGKGRFGVQIRPLHDVINGYTDEDKDAYVAWAPLSDSPWTESRKQHIRKIIRKLHKQIGAKTYELNPIELIASFFPCFRRFSKSSDWIEDEAHNILRNWQMVEPEQNEDEDVDAFYFCSELVALIYKRVGVLDGFIDPNTVVPMDLLGYDKDGLGNIAETQPVILLP